MGSDRNWSREVVILSSGNDASTNCSWLSLWQLVSHDVTSHTVFLCRLQDTQYLCLVAWQEVGSDSLGESPVWQHLRCWREAAWPPSGGSAQCWSHLWTGGCPLHAALRTWQWDIGQTGPGEAWGTVQHRRLASPLHHARCLDLVNDNNLFAPVYCRGEADPQAGRGTLHYLHQQRAWGLLHRLWKGEHTQEVTEAKIVSEHHTIITTLWSDSHFCCITNKCNSPILNNFLTFKILHRTITSTRF